MIVLVLIFAYYDENVIAKVAVKVSILETVIFTATCEKSIPEFAVPLAVAAFPSPNNPNSRCVPVASPAAKNVAIEAVAPEKLVELAAFLAVSVPSCVSHAAGAVVFDPTAT